MATYKSIKYDVDYGGKAGALIPIATTTVSSGTATVNFTSGIDSTYDEYLIIYNNVHQETDGEKFTFQGTTDGSNFNVTMTSTVWYTYSTEPSGGGGQSTTYHTGSDQAQATGYQPLNAGGGGNGNRTNSCGPGNPGTTNTGGGGGAWRPARLPPSGQPTARAPRSAAGARPPSRAAPRAAARAGGGSRAW